LAVDLADVARPEPAVLREHRPRRRLVLVVAGKDRLAAQEQLAVLRDPDLEAWKREPDRPEPERRRPVDRRRRRALRQPPALEDEDVERMEELEDVGRERRRSRDRDPDAAA